MKAVVQRVKNAAVTIDEELRSTIGHGLLVLLGIGKNDDDIAAKWLADKIAHLRIFSDDQGKMNRSVLDIDGQVLVISQFTLFGDCRKGRRPGFFDAAQPEQAIPLYRLFITTLQESGLAVKEGEFGAMMNVALINEGPVTIILDSEEK